MTNVTKQELARNVALVLAAPGEGRSRTPADMGRVAHVAAEAVWEWAGGPRFDVAELRADECDEEGTVYDEDDARDAPYEIEWSEAISSDLYGLHLAAANQDRLLRRRDDAQRLASEADREYREAATVLRGWVRMMRLPAAGAPPRDGELPLDLVVRAARELGGHIDPLDDPPSGFGAVVPMVAAALLRRERVRDSDGGEE